MKREAFYQTVPDFWPDLYGEPYALYDLSYIGNQQKQEMREATERAGRIFFKIAALLRRLDENTLRDMLYPQEAIPFLRLASRLPESVIARFDLVRVQNTWKVLELNADTPTFIKELYTVNGQVCRHFGAHDVNEGEEVRLRAAVRQAVAAVLPPDGYVVFTAHDDHVEDKLTVQYLQSLYHAPSRFVPLHQLQIVEGQGLYDEAGRRIDVLYRQTFPIESLLLDGEIGLMLLDLVCKEKLQLINPPAAFLLQNKAVLAVIWGLHQEGSAFFTEEEHGWIAQYFLPTYFEPDPFLQNSPFVKKPVFGREGDTVELYDFLGNKVEEEKEKSYGQYGFIYQQYVELPMIQAAGKEWRQVFGSFLIAGRPGAIGCRAGGFITNNLSCYLPVGLESGPVLK
ncbi:glutathionylspermidine synthase family protein [Ectobacillus ponti]|uniref:Glutathionylspermidine synthase family protein n=1 Tax=Ectobacillus ponti TaxID=2961894 RepID=A0AA42BSR4_9BACI|nr:glutathionylspermidine synthase family protein [Ectobacillus ponti]MCP8970809.1 glutathionylspermidine synthase family protein [Ectobacillus ponti]